MELLEKLFGDEIKVRSKRNLVQSREFSEMLKKTLNAYHNRAIATQEVIDELIKLAKQLSDADKRGWSAFIEARNLTGERYASAVDVIADARTEDDGRVFQPGDGRSIYGGISWAW